MHKQEEAMSRMDVVIPTTSPDFDFNEARPLSFLSTPSTPKRFGDYFMSAPTSPSRVVEFYRYFDEISREEEEEEEEERIGSSQAVPFNWEEKPGTPISPKAGTTTDANSKDDASTFRFSFKLENVSLSTSDELFDGGKIRPLKPPPGFKIQVENDPSRSPFLSSRSSSPRSPIEPGKRVIKEAFSPRKKEKMDPYETTRKGMENLRGKERVSVQGLTSSSSPRRSIRLLSPYRISEYTWDEVQELEQLEKQLQTTKQPSLDSKTSVSSTSSSSTSTSKSSSRKWRWTDFFLFRSASERRASDKYPFWKYTAQGLLSSNKHHDQEVKNSSFRSTESSGSVSKSSGRKAFMSAHELHYTLNKAASEKLKKKSFLPYKQGIFGG